MFLNPALFITVIVGTTIGTAFSTILVSRPFNTSSASDICSLLDLTYENSVVSKVVSVALFFCGIGLASIGLFYATILTGWFFMLSQNTAFIIVISAALIAALIGGSKSLSKLTAVASAVLIVGLNLPLFLQSMAANGFPIGQFTFGISALSEMWDLEDQLQSLGIPLLETTISSVSPLAVWSGGELVAAGLVVAAGVTFFPALTHHYAYAKTAEGASVSASKLLLFAAFMGVSLFALLVFTKYSLYQTTLGLGLSEARVSAPFLFSWSGRDFDLVTLCGKIIASEAAILNACPGGVEHVLGIQDLLFDGNLLLAASPDLSGLPFAFTGLLTCGIILSLVSFSSMMLYSTSNHIVSAFFATMTKHVASSRIFISRFTIILFGGVAGAFCMLFQFDTLTVFMVCISVIATVCAPSLIGALWLKQSSATTVLTSISLGLTVTLLYFVLAKYGIDFIYNNGDELLLVLPGMDAIIPPELSAIYGLPTALLVLFGSSIFGDMRAAYASREQQ
jgi:Na+(H+)/acetate symporter ActP